MSDDFGTVNVNRADRAREIDVLRQHYRRHRETLAKLTADAPTEHLASEYRHLIAEIDASLVKLDEIEGRASGAMPIAPPARPKTEPGMRPLVTPPVAEEAVAWDEPRAGSGPRLLLIVVVALVALGLIGWLIWKASSNRDEPGAIVEQPTTTATAAPATVAEEPPVTPAPASVLAVLPPSADYGEIRKGTRATRQFEVTNNSDQPVSMQVARSACRCLFYEYVELIPPKAKETVTVTVDGARAKAGELRETVRVTAKSDPSVAATFDVIATIR